MRSLSIALVALLLPAAARAQTCEPSGEATVARVRIEPRGGAPFELDMEGYPAAIRRDGDRLRVESRGALAFVGSAPTTDVPVALRRPIDVGAALTLRPSVALSHLRLRGRGARVRAELDEGVHADVGVPCDALRLGAPDDAHASPASTPDASTNTASTDTASTDDRRSEPPRGEGTWLLAPGSVRVWGVVGGPSVRLRVEPGARVRVRELDRRPGYRRIRRELDGAHLVGWVRDRDLRRAPLRAELPARVHAVTGRGVCGRGASHTYVGPATLRRGAAISDAREGHRWAHAREDVEVRVYWHWNAAWARIEEIDGLRSRDGDCPNLLEHAWVRRADLELPERFGD
ncbi:MAG TPA: hypothetical protein RMH99_21640 [Sandaracinaceae bacterium LLY-WYZ-13_1]|nr:hypothetical protein [Sandaracinaceae bacterium LLY-WYZ-13_1]